MAATTTDIANLALSNIGARRLTALDTDTSEEAKSARLHFTHQRDTLLRRHPWSFATRRAACTVAATPASEWDAAWTLPADCVRLLRIVGESPANPERDFAIEGRLILANGHDATATLPIVYISNAAAVTEWDPLFCDALSWLLAARIAQDVAHDPALVESCLQKYQRLALPDAAKADAREVLSGENFGPRTLASLSSLIRARGTAAYSAI